MDLLVLGGDMGRDIGDVRSHGLHKVLIELGDEIVVALLAIGMRESMPRQGVNVPGVVEVDIAEAQCDGPAGFGEGRHEHVGTEGDGGGHGSLDMASAEAG